MPQTREKQWNVKWSTVWMPDSNRGELKSRAKDRDNIRFTQRYCLRVYACISLRFTWMRFIWMPQVTTHKTESTWLQLHLSHIKGICSIDGESHFSSAELFLSVRFTESGQSWCEEVRINWRAWQQGKYSEEFVSLSNRLACYSILPSRQHLCFFFVLASCFTNSYCYSLTQMRQRTGEAEERWYGGTEGPRKRERNTVSCWGLKKRGEKEKRQARANSCIEKGEQLLPQTLIHTPTSPPRNPQIPSSPPFSPPSRH